jgi:protein-tyrosine phosphatase
MKAGGILLLLGALQVYAAVTFGGWWWLLAWSAVAAFVVGAAYVTASPGLLGKRHDGTLRSTHVLALLPYFAVVWGRWWLTRLLTRERPWDEVVPGLLLGRWPAVEPVPESVQVVVDLAAELPRASTIGERRQYISLPTLDHDAPPAAAFIDVARRLAETPAPVFVYCAFGHGRSAVMVAAILLRRGVARDVPEALSLLRAARPRVGLSHSQRVLLQQLETELRAPR